MKRDKTYILEEDIHLENLRKIIKRDYFGSKDDQQQPMPQMHLNSYLGKFTSKQNKVFSQLVADDKEQWKKEHWWVDKDQKIKMITASQSEMDEIKAILAPKQHHQYRNMIEGDKQRNGINTDIVQQQGRNALFFKQQKYSSYQGKQYYQSKKVQYANCRFISHDQLRQKAIDNNNEQGQIKPTQSADGMIMTWGEVDSTPLRLSGPQYRIPQTPAKDQMLAKLNDKIRKNKKQNQKKRSQILSKLFSSTPAVSQRRSSYRVQGSSIRRADSQKRTENDKMMEGLLNIQKKEE